ncbi:NAD(P)H-dependent oxidoreductase [Candidatus Parcubacteria bacterium]|jgi:NAD(P)H-dependent FMN reductase|nr:MAG: NAD(P)H-dependent oxidoreductase [Candidatus Parcubacteria bacterium]
MSQTVLGIIIGSVRKNRESIKPAKVLIKMAENLDCRVKILDLLDYGLPVYDESHPEAEKRWIQDILACDALIMVFPEYNHVASPALLNALDYLREYELRDKVVGLVSVSDGNFGGVRGQAVLKASLPTFECILCPLTVAVRLVDKAFLGDGAYDKKYESKFRNLLNAVLNLTLKLKSK